MAQYCFDVFINLFWVCVLISAIESMIVWNSIEGVDDISQPGQVIAFIVGFGGFLQTLKNLYINVRIYIVNRGEKYSYQSGFQTIGPC